MYPVWELNPEPLALSANTLSFVLSGRQPRQHNIRSEQLFGYDIWAVI